MHAGALICNYQHTKFWSSPIPKNDCGQNLKNGPRVPDHDLMGESVIARLALCVLYLHTKFGDSCFSRSGVMIGGVKTENGLFDPDHALFTHALLSVTPCASL